MTMKSGDKYKNVFLCKRFALKQTKQEQLI